MKKQLFVMCVLCGILLLSGGRLECQEPGVKLGLTGSHADISRDIPGITWGSINEFCAGFYFSVDIIGDQLGLQPELIYTTKGFDARETDQGEEVSSKYKIRYIEVPVLVYWKVPLKGRGRPGVFFGPYIGFAQKVMEVQTAFGKMEKRELGNNLKGQDFGLVFGGNVRYSIGSALLMLDIRYSLGLNNISQDVTDVAYEFREDDPIKNRALSITLGIGFNFSESEDR
jgi:hypothetical protein